MLIFNLKLFHDIDRGIVEIIPRVRFGIATVTTVGYWLSFGIHFC